MINIDHEYSEAFLFQGFVSALHPENLPVLHSGPAKELSALYGQGQGPILLDNMDCNGDESSILDCDYVGLTESIRCSHSEDISIQCSVLGQTTPMSAPVQTTLPTCKSSHEATQRLESPPCEEFSPQSS